MSEKDFLSKIAAEASKKPESFKEEVRIPVKKERKPIKPIFIIVPIVILLLVLGVVYFMFFRAKIEMPNFVGKTKQDVAAWVTQYEITPTGIIFEEAYSLDVKEDQIISQSVEAGTKVKEDVKLNFVLSLGPDPEEAIDVPDIANMDRDELEEWIEDNQLLKTKLITAYSDTVEKDYVISYEFKSCDSDEFTRGCTLNISISKGPQPAGTVTVEDFKDKDVLTVESWAKSKKVELVIEERYDDEVAAGIVMSQSIEAGKTIKEKEVLTVIVSKGKGIKVPNFNSMSKSDIAEWIKENSDVVKLSEKYSDSNAYVLSQSAASNSIIGLDDKLELTVNLGNTFYMADLNAPQTVGGSYSKLVDWTNEIRPLGIDSFAGQWGSNTEVYSEEYAKGTIVSIECSKYGTGEKYDCDGRLPLDVRFSVVLSKGKVYNLDLTEALDGSGNYDTAKLVDILAAKGITFDNNSDGLLSSLTVNGVLMNTADVKIIEGDKVVLGSAS